MKKASNYPNSSVMDPLSFWGVERAGNETKSILLLYIFLEDLKKEGSEHLMRPYHVTGMYEALPHIMWVLSLFHR